ncbi:MAG: ATP-dependent DNA helicase RecQ [Dethiobacter sp.]|jgi:superfamily II DNA/RNA helicase|nr:ATP-dependent DNA helicase RecQ [Dethiobacter sp.]
MYDVIRLVEEVLAGEVAPGAALDSLKVFLGGVSASSSGDYSRFSCAYRLCRALNEVQTGGESSWYDVAGHLRQFILNGRKKLTVSSEYAFRLRKISAFFALHVDSENEVTALQAYPEWMKDADRINESHNLLPRRKLMPVLGDGILYRMSGFTHYVSRSQKAALRLAMNLAPGHTLLACLPTGGGKSIIGQLPAWFQTKGGTLSGTIEKAGSTVVVVPTVALALDQAISSRQFFKSALSDEHMPIAYYGGMQVEKKKLIYEGLQKGTMPLIYISPEAVLNGPLTEILLDAARRGRLNTLVIDEAHIAVDWGASFRPDFQFLAPFRKKLLEASGGSLRTVLLSATMSDWTTGILKELFSEPEKIVEVRGDALRHEPMFWLNSFDSEEERRQKTMQILPLLPRPVVLYVTSPQKAREWRKLIQDAGFKSVMTFTGGTTRNKREKLLESWKKDRLDIIVATSAFGMGVDKPDIRTIIHCCLPESMDRYYQEVGRGGRDGFASLSILNLVPRVDNDEAFSLIKSRVLTVDNMTARWFSMRKNPAGILEGDTFWADTGCKPPHLEEKITGQRNAGFNENVLLFFYRRQLLDITDVQSGNHEEKRQARVRMLDLDTLNNETLLPVKLESWREQEWNYFRSEHDKIKKIMNKKDRCCLSTLFTETYPYTEPVCGGCPYCRRKNYKADSVEERVDILHRMEDKMQSAVLGDLLEQRLGGNRELLVTVDGALRSKLAKLSGALIRQGVTTLVIPPISFEDSSAWLDEMPYADCEVYSVFELYELMGYRGTTNGLAAVVYPYEQNGVDECYRWTRTHLAAHAGNRVVHVAPGNLLVKSCDRELIDLIDGGVYSAAPFVEAVERKDEADFL